MLAYAQPPHDLTDDASEEYVRAPAVSNAFLHGLTAWPLPLHHRYQNPVVTAPLGPDGLPMQVDERWVQNFYEEFYEDVFEEVAQFGEIENLNVCDNIADHMVGNVYIKFRDEEAAAKALQVGRIMSCCIAMCIGAIQLPRMAASLHGCMAAWPLCCPMRSICSLLYEGLIGDIIKTLPRGF